MQRHLIGDQHPDGLGSFIAHGMDDLGYHFEILC